MNDDEEALRNLRRLEEEYERARRASPWSTYTGEPGIPLSDYDDMMADGEALEALRRRIHEVALSVVPSEEQLADLPRWALISLAGRCARRFLPDAERCLESAILGRAVRVIEDRAARGHTLDVAGVATVQSLRDRRMSLRKERVESPMLGTPMSVVEVPPGYDAAEGIERALEASDLIMGGERRTGLSVLASLCKQLSDQAASTVRADYQLLVRLAKSERWSDDTPVPSWVWATYSSFDLGVGVDERSIIDVSSEIDTKLIQYFREHPAELYKLDSRRFEELVAELFSGFGYAVELTTRTRDQGRDVIAVAHSPLRLRFLIECKRYAADHAVGVAVVRELCGVVSDERANKGILVTTARRFSRPASQFISRNAWMLEGREFDRLVEWLELYERTRVSRT